jgi:hypothetical protein
MRTGSAVSTATRIACSAAALVSLCVGCQSTPVAPTVIEDGKSVWRRVESDHFDVEGNLATDAQTKRIASEFETLWYAFASVPLLGSRPPKQKPVVVLLRRDNEYRFLAGDNVVASYLADTVLGPLIILPPNIGPFRVTVIKHELAIYMASGAFKKGPEWLLVGLAQVMETAKYDTKKGEILFGDFSPELLYEASLKMPADRFMSPWPADLWVNDKIKYSGRSWLLVHYLIDNELRAFLDFLARVRDGENWKSAWDKGIHLRLNEVDEALDLYRDRGRYGLWTVSAYLPDMDPLGASSVPPADALALRAVLHIYATTPARTPEENTQAAIEDLKAASSLDASSVRLRTISDALQKLARAHPVRL